MSLQTSTACTVGTTMVDFAVSEGQKEGRRKAVEAVCFISQSQGPALAISVGVEREKNLLFVVFNLYLLVLGRKIELSFDEFVLVQQTAEKVS